MAITITGRRAKPKRTVTLLPCEVCGDPARHQVAIQRGMISKLAKRTKRNWYHVWAVLRGRRHSRPIMLAFHRQVLDKTVNG